MIPDYLVGSNVIRGSLKREEGGRRRVRERDVTVETVTEVPWLDLKMEKGARNQGMSAVSGKWKRQGNGFFSRAFRKRQPC